MRKNSILGIFAVLLALCACVPQAAIESAAVPVLANADFDGAFTIREAQEVEIAAGWDYSYMSGDDRWCRAPCYRPEWKPEREIAISGTSQRWFTTFARHYTAIHQSVAVERGQWYRFSCQVYAISEPDGQLAVRVGANPWNAGVFDHTMIWGQQQPWGSYREWNEAEVVFQAWSDNVRVAVGSVPNYPVKNNAAYVDNCRIEPVDIGDCPECPACPSPEPCPTGTFPSIPPCPTCPPSGGDGCDVETVKAALEDVLRGLEWRVGD